MPRPTHQSFHQIWQDVLDRRPLVLQFGTGAIWESTRLPVFLVSAYAFSIWVLWHLNLAPNLGTGASSLTAILSMVTGLMVSFRSGSSSDRWHEGRRVWASITSTSRSLLRTLVLSLPSPTPGANVGQDKATQECLALIVAFAYATKHHLRDERGVNHEDLHDLLPQDFKATITPTNNLTTIRDVKRKEPSEKEREMSILNSDQPRSLDRRATPGSTAGGAPTNVPLTILKQIHIYLNEFHTKAIPSAGSPGENTVALETATWATCLGSLKELTDHLTNAEKIRDTPIPLALGIHLQQMITLYVLAIPPQLVGQLGLWVVPVAAIAAFTFFGVDKIAEELSDPFGREPNDLPLDRFCSDLRREWLELAGNGKVSGSAGNDWTPEIDLGKTKAESKKES